MKNILATVTLALVLAVLMVAPAAAQQMVAASDFAQWSSKTLDTTPAGASQVFALGLGWFASRGGVNFTPFVNGGSITIDDVSATLRETVTISGVTCPYNNVTNFCRFTATFSHAHAAGAGLKAGDGGRAAALAAIRASDLLLYYDGSTTQVLTKAGDDAFSGSALPADEIGFGTGTGLTSSSQLTVATSTVPGSPVLVNADVNGNITIRAVDATHLYALWDAESDDSIVLSYSSDAGATWSDQPVGTHNFTDLQNALAIGSDSLPRIVYQVKPFGFDTDYALHFVTCLNTLCSSSTDEIVTANDGLVTQQHDRAPALVLDGLDVASIAVMAAGSDDGSGPHVRLFHQVVSGGTGCVGGDNPTLWNCSANLEPGSTTAIALSSQDGFPRIVAQGGTDRDLEAVFITCLDANCSTHAVGSLDAGNPTRTTDIPAIAEAADHTWRVGFTSDSLGRSWYLVYGVCSNDPCDNPTLVDFGDDSSYDAMAMIIDANGYVRLIHSDNNDGRTLWLTTCTDDTCGSHSTVTIASGDTSGSTGWGQYSIIPVGQSYVLAYPGRTGYFTITGAAQTNLTGAGSANFASLDLTGDAAVGGNLAITGDLTVGGSFALSAITGTSLAVTGTNPTLGADANERRLARFTVAYDNSINTNPDFTDANGVEITQTATHGDYSYGGGSSIKTTFLPLSITATYQASGQRNLTGQSITCYGQGDCSLGQGFVTYASAPTAGGDEGQGFSLVSLLRQQPFVTRAQLNASTVRSSCNTTITQNVTRNVTAQDVTVADTTGCTVGDWVVIQQEAPSGSPNIEAVQLLAGPAGGSIKGVFRNNHSNGVTVTPATVVSTGGVNTNGEFGQGRVLVNQTSGRDYTTGNIASISGGGFVGAGTSWADDVVGGSATNIGCIELEGDKYASAPFNGDFALKSWYQISSVTNATHLGIFTYSVAGDGAYRGKGIGSTDIYAIRPCARVLVVDGNTLVLEESSATWSSGDDVELIIPPFPDVSGHLEQYAAYTNGGTYRGAVNYRNTGARAFDSAISVDANMPVGSDVDEYGWNFGLALNGVKFGVAITTTGDSPISIDASLTRSGDEAGMIHIFGAESGNNNIKFGAPNISGVPWYLGNGGGIGSVADSYMASVRDGSSYVWQQFNLGGIGVNAPTNGDYAHMTRIRLADHYGKITEASVYMDILHLMGGYGASGLSGWIQAAVANDSLVFRDSDPSLVPTFGATSINNQLTSVWALSELGAATDNTHNKRSMGLLMQASVWDGAAAKKRWMALDVIPGSGTDDAPLSLNVFALYTANANDPQYNPLTLSQTGALTFGSYDLNAGHDYRLTLNPSGLTNARVVTVPDVAGTLAIITNSSTTKLACYKSDGSLGVATMSLGDISACN